MFGIGFTEFVIILIFGFLVFGPDKLPKIAKTVGHAIGKFRAIQKEASGAVNWKDFLDVKEVSSETKDSLVERKDTLAEKKAKYDEERKKRESDGE